MSVQGHNEAFRDGRSAFSWWVRLEFLQCWPRWHTGHGTRLQQRTEKPYFMNEGSLKNVNRFAVHIK